MAARRRTSTGSAGANRRAVLASSALRGAPGRHRRQRRQWPAAVRLGLSLVVVVVVTVGIRLFVLESFWIPSESMEPALHGCQTCRDDRIVVFRLAYHLHDIHRGDVVVFRKPPGVPDNDRYLVKRVIGLPGQSVQAHDGSVFVDNRALREPYVNGACGGTADFAPILVPAHRLLVLGDNRCNSFDSRRFGTIPASSLVGQAVARIWPLARLGGL